MKDWIYEHRIYVIITVIIAFGAIFYISEESKSSVGDVGNIVPEEIKEEQVPSPPQSQIEEPEVIMVDVKGQVVMPGVYSTREGERVIDVIHRAGGLTENADESQVNFAEHVQDAMVIYIPAKGQEGITVPAGSPVNASTSGSASGNSGKINLNKADETQLQNLPGIGPQKAAAIIEYRETSGSFKNVEDLKNISGIGDKTFEKLKDLVTVQ
ncbi:helix-hairpin-helix domain-containing protein [Neobacillus niacini]|uniref:helix-hairpin-helix domain-containing protein n=1 Tax=Neobacillus niacini TaxID=86668 RepID=UPI0039838302